MSLTTAKYCFNQGVINIKRNKLFSLASIGTIAACVFLIGVMFALIINVTHIEKQLEQKVGVSIFFSYDIQQDGIDRIGKEIKEDKRVKDITFTPAEVAWENFKKDYFKDYPELAEGFEDDNPLAKSSSYTVYLKNIEEQDEFVETAKKIKGVRLVRNSQQAKEILSSFNKLLGYVSLALIIILLGVGIFLISNTVMIGISVRQQEIKIMKLIGSTNGFVRAPFIIEGVIIGLVGSIIPLVVIRFGYTSLINLIMNKFGVMASSFSLASVNAIFAVLLPLSLGIGAGIGFIGSILSIRKHLKV